MFSSRDPVPVPPELTMNVSMKIVSLMEIEPNNFHFWGLLSYLMSHHYNLYAKDYLLLLQKAPVLVRVLYHLNFNLNNIEHDGRNVIVYLDFLLQLVVDSYDRQSILFNQEGQHMLKAVTNVFVITIDRLQITTGFRNLISISVRLIANLAYLYPEAIGQNDQRSILWFLNMGGLSILSKLFMTMQSLLDANAQCFCVFRSSMFNIFGSLQRLNTTGLDRELYCIDRNSAYRMNVAFYNICTGDKVLYMAYTLSILLKYTTYLEHYGLVSVLESLLLYKPPGKDAKSALAVVVLKCVRNSSFQNSIACESNFMAHFGEWSSQFPAVAALLDEPLRELPPDRDDKVRVCAYPGCNIDAKGLFSKMKKCSRCLNTYYCSVEHQKDHWKVHKPSCKSTIASSTTTAV